MNTEKTAEIKVSKLTDTTYNKVDFKKSADAVIKQILEENTRLKIECDGLRRKNKLYKEELNILRTKRTVYNKSVKAFALNELASALVIAMKSTDQPNLIKTLENIIK